MLVGVALDDVVEDHEAEEEALSQLGQARRQCEPIDEASHDGRDAARTSLDARAFRGRCFRGARMLGAAGSG